MSWREYGWSNDGYPPSINVFITLLFIVELWLSKLVEINNTNTSPYVETISTYTCSIALLKYC